MPEWLIGVAGAVAVPGILALWASLLKREKVIGWGVSIGSLIRKSWFALDIPYIAGKAESTLKEKLWTTPVDLIRGLFCGVAKIDPSKLKEIENK